MPKTAWNDQKDITQDSVDTWFDLSFELFSFKLYCRANCNRRDILLYLSFYRSIATTPAEGGPPVCTGTTGFTKYDDKMSWKI